MANVLTITFNRDLVKDEFLFLSHERPSGAFVSQEEFFQFTPRYSPGQIQVYDPNSGDPSPYTGVPGEYTAERFRLFYGIDFSSFGFVSIIRNSNSVIITLGAQYQWIGVVDGGLSANGDISYAMTQNDGSFAVLNSYKQKVVGSECSKYMQYVETNRDLRIVKTNNVVTNPFWATSPEGSATPKTYFIECERGVPYSHELSDISANIVNYPLSGTTGVYIMTPSLILVNAVVTSNGATVTFIFNYTAINGFETPVLQYSLDGINYVESNVFTGQADGNYTVYIKDQFDCVIQKDYTIAFSGLEESPNHFISQANSINYVLQQQTDNCSSFRNELNSFNKDGLNRINYCENILFTPCDKIKTQLKTNYSTRIVKLRKENEPDVNIAVSQQSANLNKFQSLDCVAYSYAEGLTGVYFESGNEYDQNGDVIGTYELNGNSPLMARTGNLINLDGYGDFIIYDVLYDENVEKNVILIQNNFLSLPDNTIASCLFNILPFEVVEFEVDFSLYGEGLYDVVIELTDPNFDDVVYISENIEVKEDHPNTLAISYFNENNRDIFYKYGIKHFIRIPYLDINLDVADNVENNVGDFSSELVESSINKKDEYLFDALPPNIRAKLIIALSCENLFIQGVGYIKNSAVSLEHVDNTNLAYVSQELIKTNVNYNIDDQNIIFDGDNSIIQVPGFIDTGSNFIQR